MVLDLRLLSIAAESKLPKGATRWSSLFLQDVLQGYSPYRHLIAKYNVTEESMLPLLFEDDYGGQLINLVKPEELAKMWRRWHDDPDSVLDTLSEFFPINKTNPNRAGDLYTWQSWRYDTEAKSIVTSFIDRGINRRLGINPEDPNENRPGASKYRQFMLNLPKDIKKIKDGTEKQRRINELWRQQYPNPNIPDASEYSRWAQEYQKWIGTGIRFEKLRGRLTELKPLEKGGDRQIAGLRKSREKGNEHATDVMDAFDDANNLIARMIDLQPHRIFRLMNSKTRAGIIAALPLPELRSERAVSEALEHLSFAEASLLKNRETLLDTPGKSFDNITLVGDSGYNPQDQAGWQRAQTFANTVLNYFNANKQEFLDEFIFYREFRHGFSLGVGDSPLDEFNFSGVGDTGAFARRSRDNDHQRKAALKELDLMNNLRYIQNPDDLQPFIDGIYRDIENYNQEWAKSAIADKLKIWLKFFAADWKDNVPGFGILNEVKGRNSVAKIIYGRNAAAWHPETVRSLLVKNRNYRRITDGMYNEIKKEVFAGVAGVGADTASTLAEIIAIGFLIYMVSHLNDKE